MLVQHEIVSWGYEHSVGGMDCKVAQVNFQEILLIYLKNKSNTESGRDRELPFYYFTSQWPQYPGLGQAKVCSQELRLNLPHEYQVPRTWPILSELDGSQRSQDLNQHSDMTGIPSTCIIHCVTAPTLQANFCE